MRARGRGSPHSARGHHAFSLIELLIVVAIIAALTGLAVIVLQDQAALARVTRCRQSMEVIAQAATRLMQLTGQPMTTTQALEGRYLAVLEPDPWGNPFYIQLGAVYSAGPDGDPGNADDVVFRFQRFPDAQTQAWQDARQIAQLIGGGTDTGGTGAGGTGVSGTASGTGASGRVTSLITYFQSMGQHVPQDPWGRTYTIADGWVVSRGPTGDAAQPGGAWAWSGTRSAPLAPDGTTQEVLKGVPAAGTLPPVQVIAAALALPPEEPAPMPGNDLPPTPEPTPTPTPTPTPQPTIDPLPGPTLDPPPVKEGKRPGKKR